MEEIQSMLARSADALTSGNFKDAYFCYLDIIDAAAIELRKVKFIANVAITSSTTVSLITITRSSVAYAQDILSKHNAAIAAITEPSALPRKTSLSRHSDRITSGQTKTVTMLTEQLQATGPDLCGTESQQSPSPVSSRVSSFSPRSGPTNNSTSPAASPPLNRTSLPTIPPKPTRRPPPPTISPTPPNRSPLLGFSENGTMPSLGGNISTNNILYNGFGSNQTTPTADYPTRPQSMPPQHMTIGGLESPPQSKPPLPPKPARLFRKLNDIKAEENSLDEDDSDEDDDDDDDDLEGHVFSPTLNRRASSPSIAIPAPTRRPGTPLSVPTSPTLSPSSISSSISSADRSRPYTLPQYTSSQNSAFITVIPDGSVDPTNMVEAERINGDNEDQLAQKTYGPSDHIPLIPVTPLRTTHRTLVEKEKTCSTKLAETRQKLQERSLQTQGNDNGYKTKRDSSEDEVDLQTLQENLNKYTSMISNVMATITKVRELLYRSASITSILEFPAYLVAYQLTLVESAIFLEIPPAALLTHSPKSPHRSITASTDFFNYLTRMIEYSVLFPPEASGRAQCMHYWVKVAVKLHELENFQTLKAVLSALGTPPVKRLKRTWGFVPRKSMHKLETLSELMSETRNYGKYREMMSSLHAGTMTSPSIVSPVHSASAPPSGKHDILSLNGVSSSLSHLGFRAKEAARRPMVPFLGTFIMDITYLLAAVKKTNNAAPSISDQIPATSSLRPKPASGSLLASIQFAPEDDVRIQDLLMTLTAYQSGPKYSSQPPRPYIKAATKNHHHFRAPSLSSALHRTAKYRTSSVDRQIGGNITHQSSYDEDEDDVSGNGIRPTQQLILHYLLTRPWVPERMVDELSTIREPSKNKNSSSGTASRTSTSGSTHSWPGLTAGPGMAGGGAGSMYSQISTTSTMQRGSTGSNSGDGGHNGSGGSSRPTSVDE
ncbi:DELLA protein rgl2 [Linnemannia gamsii]|uniref:DELLA protein rgl2 n=1 Tax=Linnemannia gamsii TaxID=64522 RepID=A0ABQ7JL33_9FUNG|nr:DELLA protein rgl2 [Linnemannia gamsii]